MRAHCALFLALLCIGETYAAEPIVAVATNAARPMEEIAAEFRREHGHGVRLAAGSSGNLMRQIVQGAPFELFASADEQFIGSLFQRGLTRDQGRIYAIGRIALFRPTASRVAPNLADLAPAIAGGRLRLIAIANPEHAPYGRAAREALEFAGLWELVQNLLVTGENAAKAMQFALSGSVDAALVPASFTRDPRVASRGSFTPIPADWHRPLKQRMALLHGASTVAEDFYVYLGTAPARRILSRYGYGLPESP